MNLVMYRASDETEVDGFHRRAMAGKRFTVALRRDEVPGLTGGRLCVVLANSDDIRYSDFGATPHEGTFII